MSGEKTPARIARRRRRRAAVQAEERSLREQIMARFGEAADERTGPADRRTERTAQEQERILRDMGIVDRRRLNRRHR